MKERGGGRVWDWKPQQIEAQCVKLGLDDATLDDRTAFRRERKARKSQHRQARSYHPSHGLPQGTGFGDPSAMLNSWPSSIGLQPAFPGHTGHAYNMPFRVESDDPPPSFTSEQEDKYLDDIFHPVSVKVEPEGSLSPSAAGDIDMADDVGTESPHARARHHSTQHRPSERVALQECARVIRQHIPN